MGNWFGDLDLAYKYTVVFLSLLIITIIAGFIKVLFNRRKLQKAVKTELEAGPKEDTVELNQREKDEGDLFGIRAIEAGFFAGVAQSRPTSRAGSIIGDHPAMSNSTLVGGSVNSPLMKGMSANNSTLSLNLNAPSDTTRRASPPAMKLRPSEAELTGRHHMVDMSLQVPPSPGHPRGPSSPTFDMSDNDNDDCARSLSPSGQSPYNPPTAKLPTIPSTAMRKESRSPSPENTYPRVQVHEPNFEHALSPLSAVPVRLEPRTYSPQHERDGSDASSVYSSANRLSHPATAKSEIQEAERFSAERQASVSTTMSGRTSILGSINSEDGQGPTLSNKLLVPAPVGGNDGRLSEFYEAYYRHSQAGPAHPYESMNEYAFDRQSGTREPDTSLATPIFK